MVVFLGLLLTGFIIHHPLRISEQSSDSSIVTSADDHAGVFFGQGAVQVIINDPSAQSGGLRQAKIPVTIVATIEAGEGKSDIITLDVPETAIGSAKFEFYLVHTDSLLSDGKEIHALNDAGTTSSKNTNNETFGLVSQEQQEDGIGAPTITFGVGGEINTGSKLFEDVTFRIQYGNDETILNYREAPVVLLLDRDVYGLNGTINVFLEDQDANLNPTELDKFVVDRGSLGSLFGLEGGSFDPTDSITFLETGVNTARFTGDFHLDNSIKATKPSMLLTSKDKVNYQNVTAPENNNYTHTSQATIIVENVNGKLIIPESVTFGGELKLSIDDPDQNKDSQHIESMKGLVTIAIQGGDGDYEIVNMSETAANSGQFNIDSPDSKLKISFTNASTKSNDGKLEFTAEDLHNPINITYTDPHSDIGRPQSLSSMLMLNTTPGLATLTPILSPSSQLNATLSVNDPDLNDNSDLRDAYLITMNTNESVIPLKRDNMDLGEFGQIRINSQGRVNNNNNISQFNDTITLVETTLNSSIFQSRIRDFQGNVPKVEYLDNMEMVNRTTP
jgi:hypothetical protein